MINNGYDKILIHLSSPIFPAATDVDAMQGQCYEPATLGVINRAVLRMLVDCNIINAKQLLLTDVIHILKDFSLIVINNQPVQKSHISIIAIIERHHWR